MAAAVKNNTTVTNTGHGEAGIRQRLYRVLSLSDSLEVVDSEESEEELELEEALTEAVTS